MPEDKNLQIIETEQKAFEAQLEDLMKEHAGQFVVFKDAKPVEFFQSFEQAYKAGLERFGVDAVFLVSEVKKREPEIVSSISWVTGAMFGQT